MHSSFKNLLVFNTPLKMLQKFKSTTFIVFAFNHCFHYHLKLNERLEDFKYFEGIHCTVYKRVNNKSGNLPCPDPASTTYQNNSMHEMGTSK